MSSRNLPDVNLHEISSLILCSLDFLSRFFSTKGCLLDIVWWRESIGMVGSFLRIQGHKSPSKSHTHVDWHSRLLCYIRGQKFGSLHYYHCEFFDVDSNVYLRSITRAIRGRTYPRKLREAIWVVCSNGCIKLHLRIKATSGYRTALTKSSSAPKSHWTLYKSRAIHVTYWRMLF